MAKNSTAPAQAAQGRYKPGDVIEIVVQGYEEPFRFAVKGRDYAKLQRAGKKDVGVVSHNFLLDTSQERERLDSLMNEDSADYDMTLREVLLGELMEAIGLAREATAKKLSPSPST